MTRVIHSTRTSTQTPPIKFRARAQVTQQRGVIWTNQKVIYVGFLGYLETWFQPNVIGNILSFKEVDTLFVITYDHE